MIADAWRSTRPATRAVLAVVALVVGLNLVVAGLTVATGASDPGGPTSSSYATGGDGLAGFAELLARRGHPVQQVREPLDRVLLDPATTLVLADPEVVEPGEGPALAAFVGAGGRLVVAGRRAAPLLAGLPGGGPDWDGDEIRSARPLVPVPEVAGITSVEAAGAGAWGSAGGTLPVLAGSGGVLATVASVGQGRVVALADASPLQNRLLARADNAAFGLAAVGEAGRRVAFAEAAHGYTRGTGLSAIPSRWRWAAVGGFLAALAWMWARGRRLGPVDEIERAVPPPRRAYVEAMAGALARARQPAVAVAPLQERARRRLAERGGLGPDALEDDARRVAAELGLTAEEVDALFRPPRDESDVVTLGRAATRLAERRS